MSGTWSERLDARLPLRPRDVEGFMRDVATFNGEAKRRLADLTARVEALEVVPEEAPAPPVKATGRAVKDAPQA